MDVRLLIDSSRLPVLQLRFEGTEAMHYELGPLICRAEGFRDVFMGVYRPPYQFTTPGYDGGKYPPPFYRYTWTIKTSKYEATELVFPQYDVVHYASYNAIPECRNVVTLRAQEGDSKPVVFTRQTSPPYYVSDGSEMVMNLTLTTCNQDSHLRRRKGFKASIRRADCPGTYVGTGENKGITYIRTICGVIASKEYPFPYNYYISSHMSNEYTHSWILQVFRNYVIRLEFNDFDIPPDPGAKNCTPESGILWVYNGIGTSSERLIGGFCNLNRKGILYSTSNYMTLVFSTRWKRTGNGRGFQAVFSAELQQEEITTCAEPLGIESGEISNLQMMASSNENEENYFFTNGRLNSPSGWCATFQDSAKEFTVDFWELVTVNGIVLQGLKGASKRTAVKRFYISFSNNSLVWKFEEEPIGRQKIYVCDQCEFDNYTNDLEIRFDFLKPISTRNVQIKILEYYRQPCLRLEILGCKGKDVPQLSLSLGSILRHSNILEGNDVYFECNISANPWVSETGWRFEGHELVTNISAGVIVSNQNLVLQNVQRSNRGKYSCTATNSESQGESNHVYLRVQYSPVCKQNQETTYRATLHYPVQISCEVEADPDDVEFHWEFKSSSGNLKLVSSYTSGTKSVVNYIPISESDFGTLQCWGSNSVGSQRVPCLFFVIPAGGLLLSTMCIYRILEITNG
ncbi:Neuropilin-1, partial [Stegodyphus mimosarum]